MLVKFMMSLRIILLNIWVIVSVPLWGQNFNRLVHDFLNNKALLGASSGIAVTDLQTGQNLIAHNQEYLLAPASTAKLITSGVALQLLGFDFRFETSLGHTGFIESSTATLNGNLIIRGGGDPTTGSEWLDKENPVSELFDRWIEVIRKSGIRTIKGDIVIDISNFQKWALPATWMWEDVGNYYGTGPAALNLYDNTVRLFFNSPREVDELTQIVSTKPEIAGMEWINEVRSSTINRDLAYVFGSPWDSKRVIRGTIPSNRTNFEVKASMPEPSKVFGNLLKEHLKLSGIEVTGDVVLSENKIEADILHIFYSPLLAKVCSALNYQSVNLIAESLVMQLAYQKNGFGHHPVGMKIISGFLEENVTSGPFFLDDGSGLSRFTAISARQMNDFLLYMHRSGNCEVFKSTLPVAGAGTLRSFSTKEFPGISLRCKSGSMTRVRAYAGYLVGKSGREMAFTIIVNNFPGTQQEVFRAIEELLIKTRSEF
jgi:serine-type D-Ala-D-Ala carboxypeptidase/endopeptidase (penicillin-binding protein 4)